MGWGEPSVRDCERRSEEQEAGWEAGLANSSPAAVGRCLLTSPFTPVLCCLQVDPFPFHHHNPHPHGRPTPAALEVLTLRKLFHTVLAYCLRFFATTSEIQRQQQLQLQGGMGAAGLQVGVALAAGVGMALAVGVWWGVSSGCGGGVSSGCVVGR
mgnify:CR=1 FL=1